MSFLLGFYLGGMVALIFAFWSEQNGPISRADLLGYVPLVMLWPVFATWLVVATLTDRRS